MENLMAKLFLLPIGYALISYDKVLKIMFLPGKKSSLRSFSMPFVLIKGLNVKQPVFGANEVIGNINPESNQWQVKCSFF